MDRQNDKARFKLQYNISAPYFTLLSRDNLSNKLRFLLISEAPVAFFSVLTQIARHILNGSFCSLNKDFCVKYENTLYLLSLPETTVATKKRMLKVENYKFLAVLFLDFEKALSKYERSKNVRGSQ